MPVSVASSTLIYRGLKDAGVRVVSALPETWLVHLIRLAEDDEEMTLVRLAKEEEGVGISTGAHLAGVKSAMLISQRGSFGERDPWQCEGGGVTEHVLEALRIPYERLEAPEHVTKRIAKAQTLAHSASRPVALLLCRDLMWED